MLKNSLLAIAFMFSIFSFAQINFEKGYYINNQGEKIDCLIKNMDWKNNPVEIKFKLTENSDVKTLSVKSFKSFKIEKKIKFERHKVKIDRESNALNHINFQREPNLKIETLMLKVLVEGQATLYQYTEGGLTRFFFFNASNKGIEPLIYKRYKNYENNVLENNEYKQQLLNYVKCQDISIKTINEVKYTKNSLTNYFKTFYSCKNVAYKDYTRKISKNGKLNLSIRPGVNFSSLDIQNKASTLNLNAVDFGSQVNFRLGLELEYVLPFNKNKWSLFIEPTYQSFSKKGKSNNQEPVEVSYNSIELPIGIRHYLYLNNNSRMFINTAFIYDISSSSKVDYENYPDLDVKSNGGFAFGLGYKYKKFSLECRYFLSRDILSDYLNWEGNYQTTAFILGYSFF